MWQTEHPISWYGADVAIKILLKFFKKNLKSNLILKKYYLSLLIFIRTSQQSTQTQITTTQTKKEKRKKKKTEIKHKHRPRSQQHKWKKKIEIKKFLYVLQPIVVLLDPCLLGLFWASYMLFFHLTTVTQHCHWVCIHAT